MPEQEMKKFATFMKEKREALGLSQSDLAVLMYGDNKKRSYINEIESGARKGIGFLTACKILKALKSNFAYYEE